MLSQRSTFSSFLSPYSSNWVCFACQSKSQWQYRHASSNTSPAKPSPPKALPPRKKLADGESPPLQPLSRPIGVDKPPKLGDNPAKDPRRWAERRDTYWDKDAHTERRRKIMKDLKRPYYRDWNRMRHHKGKTFIAPPALLKTDFAKYMPNMQGYTLANSSEYTDTIKVLRGKVSIVSYVSERWAESQAMSFVGKQQHPELASLVDELDGKGLQRVWINHEDDWFKALLVYLFLPYGRRKSDKDFGKEMRERSFVVRKGVDREFFEGIGITNLRVGHVYLVDRDCRIRWAANGDANEEEKANLVRCARRLVGEEVRTPVARKGVGKIADGEKRPLAAMMQ